ncbi:hypothetical protein CNYM01_07103 [Colletotrichum nymphaeae SA-01]|uniref:Uncharacterized protein n=1 Tax=Colletotrichum nymphaeae SA-01 TaxID=1460502 RepID=A0A135TBX2_9PEZI|nr:hypothetical protein CNYM01_07103 [Colletotrichum nymphaeae SA-01]
MNLIIELPNLPPWAQQLVGILPLTALIEFIEEAAKLHVFELSGLTPAWCWPISPKGARLLLSTDDTTNACCLDRPGAWPTLHCMDTKFGDHYPSAAAATTRLFLRSQKVDVKVENSFVALGDRTRQQKLYVYVVEDETSDGPYGPIRRLIDIVWGPVSLHYALVSLSGWILWAAGIICSLLSGTFYGMIYLLLMPVSGHFIGQLFGTAPRSLKPGRHNGNISKRLIVSASSLNGQDWNAFIGSRNSVNALLNRPLQRKVFPRRPNLFRWMLRFTIMAQWSIIIIASTLQGWDAAVVTFWTAFCSLSVTYLYSSEDAASDWLKHQCRVRLKCVRANLGTRRSLLGALVHLNPDRESTDWMNPILARSSLRDKWEKSLLEYIRSGSVRLEDEKEYWVTFIKEGAEVGKNIADAITKLQEHPLSREKC